MRRRKLRPFERVFLYRQAGGRCALCGVELDPLNFHADHIEPFCVTGRTNVFDMQALCAACNLRKGARHVGKGS
jgi:5-methylcytosine-specific restriction endonuclease McrA